MAVALGSSGVYFSREGGGTIITLPDADWAAAIWARCTDPDGFQFVLDFSTDGGARVALADLSGTAFLLGSAGSGFEPVVASSSDWQLWVAQRRSGVFEVYIVDQDGTTSTPDFSGDLNGLDASLAITSIRCGDSIDGGSPFTGEFAEVGFWTGGSFTAAQVTALAAGGIPYDTGALGSPALWNPALTEGATLEDTVGSADLSRQGTGSSTAATHPVIYGGPYNLTITGLVNANLIGELALTQNHQLSLGAVVNPNLVGAVALTQNHQLVPGGVLSRNLISELGLSQNHQLSIGGARCRNRIRQLTLNPAPPDPGDGLGNRLRPGLGGPGFKRRM